MNPVSLIQQKSGYCHMHYPAPCNITSMLLPRLGITQLLDIIPYYFKGNFTFHIQINGYSQGVDYV